MAFKANDTSVVPSMGQMSSEASKGGHDWSPSSKPSQSDRETVQYDEVEVGPAEKDNIQAVAEGSDDVQPDPTAATVTSGEGNEIIVTPQGEGSPEGIPSHKDDYEEVDAYEEGTAGINSQIDTLDKWMASAKAPETKEEREKRERKEKSRRVISAVSDGLSALSNLFFTTRYAPDMYDHKQGMTGATNAQIEKARAEREKNEDAYYNFALKRGQLEHQRAATLREIEAQLEKQAIERQRAENEKEKNDGWLRYYGVKTEGQELKNEGQADKNRGYKADADRKETQAENEQRVQDDKHNESVSKQNRNNRAGTGGSGGRKKAAGGYDEVTVTEEINPKTGKVKKVKRVTKNSGKGTKGKTWSLKN